VAALGYTSFLTTTFTNNGGSWGSDYNGVGTTYDYAVPDPGMAGMFAGFTMTTPPGLSLMAYHPTVRNGQIATFVSGLGTTPAVFPNVGNMTQRLLGATTHPLAWNSERGFVLLDDEGSIYFDYIESTNPPVAFDAALVLNLWGTAVNYTGGSLAKGWLAADGGYTVFLTRFDETSPGSGLHVTDRLTFDGATSLNLTKSWTRADHVVTVLTTGELLTREGGYYHVCDTEGTITFTFPAGRLRFAGEFAADAASPYRSWFTSVLPEDASHSYGDVTVRVYSIETSQLSSLR
jgi:hypothetical protein